MTDLVERAQEIAIKAHEGQTRWDGSPYITHPASVVKRLIDSYGLGADTLLILGWLHDVVEDTSVTLHSLSKEFDDFTIRILSLLTHQKEDSYARYISKVKSSQYATLVKIADLEDNLATLKLPKDRQRIDKYELAKLYLIGEAP